MATKTLMGSAVALDLHLQVRDAGAWCTRWNDAARSFAIKCAVQLNLGRIEAARHEAKLFERATERRSAAWDRYRALCRRLDMTGVFRR